MKNVDKLVDALIERMHGGRGNMVTGSEGCAWVFLITLGMVFAGIWITLAIVGHMVGR